MTFCPGCKVDYEGECPKCSPVQSEAGVRVEENWDILTTVGDDMEFGMLKSLLEIADIPVIRKVRGVDNFLQIVLGTPLAGIDVLVPKDRYEEAVQLISTPVDEEDLVESVEDEK
ncbi:MAG: DUF2007 domain-containing protein [Clostridia bacterium]|nr:DUF2007 domain-containing protein [Clostridia bacterium]